MENNQSDKHTEVSENDGSPGIEKTKLSGTKALKHQIEKTMVQKNQLVKQLDELENERSETDSFYKRALLVFIRMIPAGENSSLLEAIEDFKALIQKDVPVKEMAAAMESLKDQTLKGAVGKKEEKGNRAKPFSFFSKFLKSDLSDIDEKQFESDYFESLKESYQEIIDEFKLHLNKVHLKKIIKIEQRINEAGHIDDLHTIRSDILYLIHEYISSVGADREKTATFIRVIGKRLIEMEKFLLTSLSNEREIHQGNTDFNKVLMKNITALKKNVDHSKTIEQLKEAVAIALVTLKKTIEGKAQKDISKMKTGARKVKDIEKELGHIKDEMDDAKAYAVLLEKELLMDSLTGIFNRRAYDRKVKEEMERYLRYQHAFSLLLLDVDHFKQINDSYGHAIGDKCLKEIINHIKPKLRKTDFLCRYGGEEFVVILPETDSEYAGKVAEKLRQTIEKIEFIHRKETIQITISIGVTQSISDDKSYEAIFNRVDKAMYQSKSSGRNKVVRL